MEVNMIQTTDRLESESRSSISTHLLYFIFHDRVDRGRKIGRVGGGGGGNAPSPPPMGGG